MVLRGTLGAIMYTRDGNEVPLALESMAPEWRGASRRKFLFTPTPSPGYGGLAGVDFFRAFLNAKATESTPANAVDALRVLEALDSIHVAAATGRAVELS